MQPILDFLRELRALHAQRIEQWLEDRREDAAPYITTSVDIRHCGSRMVPVDTNLYPAGFNNLSRAGEARAIQGLRQYFQTRMPDAKRILIVPENHTRNLNYLESLWRLQYMLSEAGLQVAIGNLGAEAGKLVELTSASGKELVQEPLVREGDRVQTESGFVPDFVLLNNDLTSGIPKRLEGITQPVCPPLSTGWYRRRKSTHFAAYRELAEEFASEFRFDPWLISALFYKCGMINFQAREGLDCLAKGVDCVLEAVARKYAEYGIKEEPYVFVKADSGTYGMGIMTVRSGAEMLELNKKARNKMQVIKEGTVNSEVIIQEGVPTIDKVDGSPAEPVIYMIDGQPVGGLYRVNVNRDAKDNLNAAGMTFAGMCDEKEDGDVSMTRCHMRSFGLIASIAALAAAREDMVAIPEARKLCAEA